jgi:hypothetical protein
MNKQVANIVKSGGGVVLLKEPTLAQDPQLDLVSSVRKYAEERDIPFRAPHFTVSLAGMVGSTKRPGTGEVHLADGGVLMLLDFPEFRRSVTRGLGETIAREGLDVTVVGATDDVTPSVEDRARSLAEEMGLPVIDLRGTKGALQANRDTTRLKNRLMNG